MPTWGSSGFRIITKRGLAAAKKRAIRETETKRLRKLFGRMSA